jgi:UDP-N-acetylmuramoyl-tripeptide--D-alanyl-D-alanine ligase
MIPLDLATVATAVGGRLHLANGSETVSGSVEFDTRNVERGGLFVAVPGQRVDGHDFAKEAIANGAIGVLAGREVPVAAVIAPPVENTQPTSILALAGDTYGHGAAVLAALAKLARHVVSQLPRCTVIGVTGSCGKTSTKDLIAHLLEPMGPTVASPRSFNNELGQPWTILRARENTRHLVLELGTRGIGHLTTLCSAARPRIGVVLNVGDAHIGEFGSQAAIARGKGELVEALPDADDGGVAVLNADDSLVAAMAERTSARVTLTGRTAAADVRATNIELDRQGRPRFTLSACTDRYTASARVALSTHGEHQVDNALAATAVALELGAGFDDVANRLEAERRVAPHRMAVHATPNGATVIDDARNASSRSMEAALRTLASMARVDRDQAPRRTWAVLGGMRELGEATDEAHDRLGRLAMRLGVERVVAVGTDAQRIHEASSSERSSSQQSVLVSDVQAAITLLREELRADDIVLVKGARVAALWRIAEALLPAGTSSTGRDGEYSL